MAIATNKVDELRNSTIIDSKLIHAINPTGYIVNLDPKNAGTQSFHIKANPCEDPHATITFAIMKDLVSEFHERSPASQRICLNEMLEQTPAVGKTQANITGIDCSSRYQLFDCIGEGGMGQVFRGRDTHLHRDLALKVMRPKYRRNPEALRRFVFEAQIGSQLQHPSIVPVHELGEFVDGTPYFTMKLIEGSSFHQELRSRDTLTRERLRHLCVFEQVCQAIAYAHEQGVVHRDLKPSNVLVGRFGEVQVTDWGLSKRLMNPSKSIETSSRNESDDTEITPPQPSCDMPIKSGLTHPQAVLGTPAYMSPEQARSQHHLTDQRSDVFCLGAMLCEIITGEPPYLGDSQLERAQRADLSDAFSRLDRSGADQELINLTKRCMAKDPSHRPCSAKELADNVGNYLRGLEIKPRQAQIDKARSDATALEERKRRKVTIGLAISVLLTIATVLGSRLYVSHKSHEQERQILVRRAKVAQHVDTGLREAEVLRQQTIASGTFDSVTLARCQELVKSIIEFSKDELIPEALRDRVKSLQSNLHRDGQEHRFYSRLVDARMPKPRPTEFSSGTTFTINDVSTETRSPRAASSLIAVDSRTSRFDQRPQLQAILNAFDEYGFRLGVDEPSLVANELQSFRPILENEAILSLWAASAIASAYGQRADWITSILGHIAADPWQTEFRAAVFDADRQKLVNMSQRPDTLEQPATFQLLLAKQLSRFGEYSAAEAFLRETQLRAPNDFWINYELAFLLDSEPNATEIQRIESLRFYTAALAIQTNAGSYLNLGTALYHRNELDAAIRAYRLAIRLQPDYAIAHSSVASALAKQEKFDEAIQAYERAIQCKPDYAEAFNNVGALLNKQQKYAEAIDVLQHAIQYRANYALAYDNLGFSYLNVGQFDKATEALNKAIAIDDQLSSAYGNLGHIRMLQGKNDEKTIELLEKAISTNPQNAEAHVNLGGVYGNRGLTEKAIESFDRAIEINPDLAEAHLSRGMALSRQMKFELAAMSFREALRVRPGYVVAHFNLGSVLANMHRHDEAIEAFGKAIELQDNIAEAHFRLGSLYSLKRDFEKAIPSLRNTIKFKPDHLEAHVHLGHALANQGKLPEAIAAFESAARIKRNPVVLLYLGTARNQVGDYAGAIEALEDCVKLTPNNIAALQQLARLLASCPHDDCRDGKRAVDLATKLCQLTGYSNSDALSALGIAHAENGDFEQAIKCIEDAMTHSIAIQQSEFQKLIALFKDRMPFRSPEAATAESM